MSVEEEYPINELLDQLIQVFKSFRMENFPRGIPQPVSEWKPLLQAITKYEAQIAKTSSDYLGGRAIDISHLVQPKDLNTILTSKKVNTTEDSDYLNSLMEYKTKIEKIAHLTEDCAHELGNPCKTFRLEQYQK